MSEVFLTDEELHDNIREVLEVYVIEQGGEVIKGSVLNTAVVFSENGGFEISKWFHRDVDRPTKQQLKRIDIEKIKLRKRRSRMLNRQKFIVQRLTQDEINELSDDLEDGELILNLTTGLLEVINLIDS